MCGIAGFVGNGNQSLGQKMIQTISYRGPDFQSSYHKNNVCLAHARLSIIDVSAASHQPMLNIDETIALTFNGEIYNYLELKAELIRLNKYKFKTSSDTEVLLYYYQEYGESVLLEKINGMFVFAIYDFTTNKLIIARDRMGKKPLYYSQTNTSFVFGSEVKAVLAHPEVSSSFNYEAINQYLTFDYIPAPNSLYEDISKLPPAHYLVFKDNEIEIKPYWTYNYTTNYKISFDDAKSRLDDLLNQATKARLMSDVPLGVFLSGGIDSSAIAYYAQKNSIQKIKTFSIGFEDKSYDEKDYAREVSTQLGTEHYESILTARMTLGLIDEVFSKLDEPFADASILPTYYLSKFTREQVTVSLGGDGSDELLAGYPTFISDKYKFLFQYLPKGGIEVLKSLVNSSLKPSDDNISFDFKVKQFLRGFTGTTNQIHQLWLGSFLPSEKQNLFNPEVYNNLRDKNGLGQIAKHFSTANELGIDAWHQIIYYYCQTYLPDDILFKVDRASMYNSLEVRAPFLDKSVVEFLNILPLNYKLKGHNGKYILKSIMRDRLPPNVIDRPKKGFGIPLSNWIKNELKGEINDVLLQKDKLFNQRYIEKILKEHIDGVNNHRKLIWNLYCLKRIII